MDLCRRCVAEVLDLESEAYMNRKAHQHTLAARSGKRAASALFYLAGVVANMAERDGDIGAARDALGMFFAAGRFINPPGSVSLWRGPQRVWDMALNGRNRRDAQGDMSAAVTTAERYAAIDGEHHVDDVRKRRKPLPPKRST
jgi:hypothetical protein